MLNSAMTLPEGDKSLLKLFRTNEHPFSGDCIEELYHCLVSAHPGTVVIKDVKGLKIKLLWMGFFRRLLRYSKPKILFPVSRYINFSAQIGPDLKMCIPDFFFTRKNFIYMFDAWPRFHEELGKMFDLMNVNVVFFSSREVTAKYQSKISSACKAYWIPEGIHAAEYTYLPHAEKRIDVLEFGRIYQQYHDDIAGPLAAAGKQHLFNSASQRILFETKVEFKDALANTKICICVPSHITHPERAEDISTMTLRYLQCMASKCLIVGIMPDEMHDLFDYMPMIEIDAEHAAPQILELLENYDRYQPLIDRNYQAVMENHQWQNRWQAMKEIIQKEI